MNVHKRGNGIFTAIIVIILTLFLVYSLHSYEPAIASVINFYSVVILLMRTFIIFIFSFIMLRLLGKRQLSQLTFIDLLIIIALGSAVGDVMIYTESITPMINSVLAVGFITILVMVVNKIIAKNVDIGRLIEGRSTVLVKKGKILRDNLVMESMNEDELRSELRERNYHKLSDLEEVILEPTGRLSVRRKKRKVVK